MTDFSLRNSLAACRRLTYASKSSFAPAFALLPSAKRQAMEVLYAYNRFTDDLVDMPDVNAKTGQPIPTSPRRKLQKLNQWAGVLEATLGSLSGNLPIISDAEDEKSFQELAADFPGCAGLSYLPALKKVVDRFQIPIEPFFHLIEGVESDIEPRRFETFDDCADYCHQVATSVGFASLAVWGTTEPLFSDNVVHAAKACGIAFQWTNILRDLLEDYRNDRIYLPQNELTRVGLTEKQFGSLLDRKSWNEQKKRPKDPTGYDQYAFDNMLRQMETFETKFDRLLAMQIERCEIYYTNAVPLYRLIERDSRRVYGMMWSRYRKIFEKIRRHPLRITRGRVRLSMMQKLRLFLRWKFLFPRQL